jgi:hypothetical protein
MAKTKISEFDSTPANNTDIDSINIAEGCAPSGINNAIRELMSQLKDQQTGASGDNFTVGGNLTVTGTTVHTGATTFTGAVVMSTALPIASGGTAATTAAGARTSLGVAASGANSDITSVTGLTTALTVAQGGTGAATHTSKGVLIGNGTSAVTTVSPGTTGNVLKSDGTSWTSATLTIKGLGLGGEVWNNVTASRAAGSSYTNSNAYPIMFAISATKSASSNTQGSIDMIVDGLTITQVASRVGNNIDHSVVILSSTVIVPPGKTYSVTLSGDTSLTLWRELY